MKPDEETMKQYETIEKRIKEKAEKVSEEMREKYESLFVYMDWKFRDSYLIVKAKNKSVKLQAAGLELDDEGQMGFFSACESIERGLSCSSTIDDVTNYILPESCLGVQMLRAKGKKTSFSLDVILLKEKKEEE